MKKGTLYLIPTPISEQQQMSDILLPDYLELVSNLEYFVVEKGKVARKFLTQLPLKKKVQELNIEELDKHSKEDLQKFLRPLLEGKDLGLMSDAGVPTVADPGFKIVALAQKHSIKVTPLVGPSSILLALMASGLNGQSFTFHGYLSREKGLKRKKIKTLERIAQNTNQTQIFMETPYRNQSMLEDILDVCEEETLLCIAMDIMGEKELLSTRSILEWKEVNINLEKKPCLFLINKNI